MQSSHSLFQIVIQLIILGFILPLAAKATRFQVDVKSHPDEIRSKRNERSTVEADVVTPVRMREDLNDAVSSGHYRKRRSVEPELQTLPNNEFDTPVYKIHAFGEDILVRLTPDNELVAPSFTTTYSWKNETISDFDSSKQSLLRKCFYKGTVIGQPSSQVALSICDSLTGSIYTEDYHYFITPVSKGETTADDQDTLVPHTIQRRSVGARKKRSAAHHSSSCGVNDDRHKRRYLKTFMNSPLEEMANKVVSQARAKRSLSESAAEHESEKNVIDFEIESEDRSKSRSKRSFDSKQYYIETMVVADASMVREHGDDLEHYILSIMMVANRIFAHPSLGSAIALNVVKIVIAEDEHNGPKISSNAAHTLRDFCIWQQHLNTPDDSHPEHFDLAILMTKTDLCGDSCDTLGMAEVGAMCSTRHSCAIVEDDGLSASYTLAHEVGHVLNMMHDDNRMCRENFAKLDSNSHVMSSTMDRVDSDQPWSLCSRQAVIDFLQDGRGDCLLDRPQEPKVYPNDLPGVMYDVNAQCSMSFGSGAVECPYMRECSRLWCQLPRGTRANQCHTRSFPRADGSPCAPGNHCMKGKCVRKGPQLEAINGNWGSWSHYGSCSRTCGGGVQMSSRQCNSPAPRNGGKYCIGSRLHFRSCNTDPCRSRNGKEPRDFRSEQCASYNGQRFPLLGVRVASTWIPKYAEVHPKDRCKLICQSVQTGSFITLADRVVDGTRCGPDTTDICVHGQCMPAGCDGVLGSKAKFNKCGLCKERNSRCKRVKGKYNKRQSGYNDVVVLPVGAATIKVQQKGFRNKVHDGNYLALVNSAGQYLLNGALTLSTLKKDIEVNGSVLQYTGVRVSTEKIHSSLPIKEPITVQVLSLGLSGAKILPPRIKYSYYVVKPKSSRRSKIHRTVSSDSNIVSRRRLKPEPRSNVKTRNNAASDDANLLARWVTGRWAKCKAYGNRKCGAGWKNRKVTCKKGKSRSHECEPSTKPYHRLPCYISNCPTATPVRRHSSSSLPSWRKSGPAIVNRYIQHNQHPVWIPGRWGPCSTSCGKGIKKRHVNCKTRSGRLLSSSACKSKNAKRPSEVHGCKLRDCP